MLILLVIRIRAATLSFTLFSDLQATNEVLHRLLFIISGIRGMTRRWVDSKSQMYSESSFHLRISRFEKISDACYIAV